MSDFQTIDDVWQYLHSILMFQKSGAAASNFSLDNIRSFCELLDNPQNKFPSVHIAGTNGKGTTAHLLESIYTEAGYKTGLFTSPHLLRYHERVRVGSKEITDQKILEFFQKAERELNKISLSYFEISTALAFWYFADQQIDIGIIETGLGGRLDSTNIISPELSIITSIGLDHQSILGRTFEEIAREKAGIIKQDSPVIVGNVPKNAKHVIERIAMERNAGFIEAADLDPEWNKGTVSIKGRSIQLKTNFLEAVNAWNIAMVWLAVEVLNDQFPVSEKEAGTAIENFNGVPARFEKIHPEYDWYFSGSHNEEALESSLRTIKEMNAVDDTVLIFSMMKDKINEDVIESFKEFKLIYFIEQEGERAAKWADIADKINAELITENQKENILNELKTELVIFTGSFYFYPIVKRWITNVS